MTRPAKGSRSSLDGQGKCVADQCCTSPVRQKNVDRTLKDLEYTKRKNYVKCKCELEEDCTSKGQQSTKTVRFGNVYEGMSNCPHNFNTRKICSDEQIYVPTWMRNDKCDTGEKNLWRSKSDGYRFSKKYEEGNSMHRLNGAGSSNFLNKLKKICSRFNGKPKKKKRKLKSKNKKQKNKQQKHCMQNFDLKSSNYCRNFESSGSCTTSSDSEAAKSEIKQEICIYDGEEDLNQQLDNASCGEEENLEYYNEEEYESNLCDCEEDFTKDAYKKKSHNNVCNPIKTANDSSFKALRNFWEPRNGLNDCHTTKQIDERAKENCAKELSPQTSTETLVASQDMANYMLPTPDISQCNGFLNYKTSPICCSLDTTSASYKESESDIKKTIRSLKKAMALRKKMQKMELKQLKEEMRCLKRNHSRNKKNYSGSSSCSWSSTTADCGSLSNLLEASQSSCSNNACSVISVGNSSDCIRTVLNGHPCRSIPDPPATNYGQTYANYANNFSQPKRQSSKCSQLKQQYSVKNPMWSEPVSRQRNPSFIKSPKSFYRQRENPMSSNNLNSTCNIRQSAPKVIGCDSDPTNWLWNQIIVNTPCDSSSRNDSIITCYVNMYRNHAADAIKKRKGCFIDPLEFRYGYQNEKHANGPVNVCKKGDANVLWTSKAYGSKCPKQKQKKKDESASNALLRLVEKRSCSKNKNKC